MAAELTCEDVWAMPADGYRRELIDGMLIVNPAPRLPHQRIVTRLAAALIASCPDGLEVFAAPVDWVVSDTTLLQPDIVVARPADYPEDQLNLRRPPVLVIEVLSPSTARYDAGTKRLAYEAAGVAWYWLIEPNEPNEPRLTVLQLVEGTYVEAAAVSGDRAYEATEPFVVRVVPADLVRT